MRFLFTTVMMAGFLLSCAPTADWKCYCKNKDTGTEYLTSIITNEKSKDAEAVCRIECEVIDEELYSRVEEIK
ncbi:MAG: hypothetical protein GXO48_02245 [Chlorobi bacterium]|nr:hypothetical protein [Chlorobiota bacterium]